MAKRFAVALKPNVNVRRGTNVAAGILGSIAVGEQLEIVGDLILISTKGEQWAQVIWEKDLTIKAYCCIKLASGNEFCKVITAPEEDGSYKQGWNDAVDGVIAALTKMRM